MTWITGLSSVECGTVFPCLPVISSSSSLTWAREDCEGLLFEREGLVSVHMVNSPDWSVGSDSLLNVEVASDRSLQDLGTVIGSVSELGIVIKSVSELGIVIESVPELQFVVELLIESGFVIEVVPQLGFVIESV